MGSSEGTMSPNTRDAMEAQLAEPLVSPAAHRRRVLHNQSWREAGTNGPFPTMCAETQADLASFWHSFSLLEQELLQLKSVLTSAKKLSKEKVKLAFQQTEPEPRVDWIGSV